MSAPPRQHGRPVEAWHKGCTQKRRFSDELTARAGAQIECDHKSTKRGAMWVYSCENCRGWHITNKPGNWRRMVTVEHLFQPGPPEPEQRIATPHLGGFWGGGMAQKASPQST